MSRNLVILGGGVMGESILAGFLDAGVDPKSLSLVERTASRRAELATRYGVQVFEPGSKVVGSADLLWLVVKPADALALLDEIAPEIKPGAILVSLCAGLSTQVLSEHLPDAMPVVRVMPNTPARIKAGMSAVSAGAYATPDQVEQVRTLMASVGEAVIVPEAHQDGVTAVSGSGPAYLFAVAEAMIAAGVELGLSAEIADSLVRQTLFGSAKLLSCSADDAGELRSKVTSPNGTTAAALKVFDDAGLAEIFSDAMQAAAQRSVQLGRESGGVRQ